MTERVAVITGGAKGIGRAVGIDLAKEGWSIALCYRKSEKEAADALEEIKKSGVRGMAVKCDVSDSKAAVNFVKMVEKEFGRIDALINGAGPYHRVNLLEETVEGWHSMFDNNLHPVFYLSRAVAEGMRTRKWGRIITFSMSNADQMVSQPHITAHYISKVGILILTRSLAKLLGPHGITVNAISPGFIDSGSALQSELQNMIKNIPAGYIGTTGDVVSAVKFLLSNDARYINGANIQISGGWGV
jgi:3-oxoacyl-[acyl-carrier protein] reductase